MDPFTGALVVGGGLSLLGGLLGSSAASSQAEAQQRAAEAQAAAIREQARLAYEAQMAGISERRQERQMALGFAAPSSVELQAQSNFLDLQNQILGRTRRELEFLQRGLDVTSPGAAQAGQGLFSSIIMRQRAQQRSALESQLRQRFGAGYATTSAGQSALQQFDQGTVDVGVQAIPSFLGQAYQAIGAPVALEQSLKTRQMAAAQATPVSPMFGQLAQTRTQFAPEIASAAGAPFVGDIQRAAGQAQLANVFGNIGGQALGYGLMGKFGAFNRT